MLLPLSSPRVRHRVGKAQLILILLLLCRPSVGTAQLSRAATSSREYAAAADPELGFPDPYGVEHTWTSRDKYYHFGVSALGAAAVYSGARWLGLKRWPAVALSVGVVGAVGVFREWHDDNYGGKYFSEKDLIWNAGGIAVGILIPDRFFFRRDRNEPPG